MAKFVSTVPDLFTKPIQQILKRNKYPVEITCLQRRMLRVDITIQFRNNNLSFMFTFALISIGMVLVQHPISFLRFFSICLVQIEHIYFLKTLMNPIQVYWFRLCFFLPDVMLLKAARVLDERFVKEVRSASILFNTCLQ